MKKLTQTKLIFICSILFGALYNYSFFNKTLQVYPLKHHYIFVISLSLFLLAAINLILNIIRIKYLLKPMLIVIFILSALAAHVMDQYGLVIDGYMLANSLHAEKHEVRDLLTVTFFAYIIFLGIVPSVIISKLKIEFATFKKELTARLVSIVGSLLIILIAVLPMSKSYASFFREQKPLRYYTNPTYYMYSLGKNLSKFIESSNKQFVKIGLDAKVKKTDNRRNLVILVVGETARRDRFSLNGYYKETNPLLRKESVYSFTNVTSCGTSTVVSLPCMFSPYARESYSDEKAANSESLLDVLDHTKQINVLWRDNNSDSKGVALRVQYEDYKYSPTNSICDPECRDVGMLIGLQEYIKRKKDGDIFIVLHQMGNHGPAYYKRYPESFEKFKPACKTSELSECTNNEINNAYDNAILYTDFFLSKVIELLKQNSKQFNTAMVYISDHGESLGEKGIYLHSMPFFIAPDEQKDVPLILWFGGEIVKKLNKTKLRARIQSPYSHDNLFHTILGLLNVETSIYEKDLNILEGIF
jgi:lipid A ethanolaminephosphotransferase